MVPHLLFYQLLLVALVLMGLLMYVWWPASPHPTPRTPRKPDTPRCARSPAPNPFPGLIHKPLWAACEQDADERPKAPDLPPPMIAFARGRRRTVDTRSHCCPDPDCAYYGRLGHGNLRANGHPGGQRWRQVQCVSCQRYFSATHGTIFQGKRTSPELIVRVIACLAAGLGIRGTARVFEIDPNTVLSWLVEAAEQLQAFSAYFLQE
jgi:transposase-like protein